MNYSMKLCFLLFITYAYIIYSMSYNNYGNYNYHQGQGYGQNAYPDAYRNNSGGYRNSPPQRPQNRPQNRQPDRRRSAQSEKYRRAGLKRNALMAALALFFIAEVIVIALLANSLSKKPAKSTETSATSATSETTVPTTTTTETTPRITISEKLPASSLADSYWGPLPVCEAPKQYKHFEVKGLYTRAAVNLDKCISIANNSELNTFVVDLKESEGIYYQTTNETAISVGYNLKAYDLNAVVKKCHDAGIYVIGRIVCFKDPAYVSKFPDRAICDSAGNPLKFKNEGKEAFASPYDKRNWDYYISLAEEAISFGVDEIQFDYVRFPTGGSTSGEKPYYGQEGTVPSKAEAINRFLQTARIRLQDTYGIPVTADIFGIAVTSTLDGEILGQDWATLGFTGIDSLCPMIYPSHYALGTILNGVKFEKPDKNPYDVMYNALKLSSKVHTQPGYSTVRPYVQAFTASYIGEGNYMKYDYDAINRQIKAIQDNNMTEFILWNASGNYVEGKYGGNQG